MVPRFHGRILFCFSVVISPYSEIDTTHRLSIIGCFLMGWEAVEEDGRMQSALNKPAGRPRAASTEWHQGWNGGNRTLSTQDGFWKGGEQGQGRLVPV
jgi:hypothetical protein